MQGGAAIEVLVIDGAAGGKKGRDVAEVAGKYAVVQGGGSLEACLMASGGSNTRHQGVQVIR